MKGIPPDSLTHVVAFLAGSAVSILGVLYVHWSMPVLPVALGGILLAGASESAKDGNNETASRLRSISVALMAAPILILLFYLLIILIASTWDL